MKPVFVTLDAIDLRGWVIGVYEGSGGLWVWVTLEGRDFLLVCSSREKYEAALSFMGITGVTLKRIHDAQEFLDSVAGIPLMLDPYITPEGNTRFKTLFVRVGRSDEESNSNL